MPAEPQCSGCFHFRCQYHRDSTGCRSNDAHGKPCGCRGPCDGCGSATHRVPLNASADIFGRSSIVVCDNCKKVQFESATYEDDLSLVSDETLRLAMQTFGLRTERGYAAASELRKRMTGEPLPPFGSGE